MAFCTPRDSVSDVPRFLVSLSQGSGPDHAGSNAFTFVLKTYYLRRYHRIDAHHASSILWPSGYRIDLTLLLQARDQLEQFA